LSIKGILEQASCPHVFLLCGERGTGKTTIARIMKEKLGCGNRDFVELNAANTRGIDTVREIYNSSGYAPTSGKSRVYLLDECHQLTSTAQEALLKITEDAPDHVYFILSTTNPEKLIATLRSRCTTYKTEKLTRREIIKLLTWVLVEEGFPQDDIDYFTEVIVQIARVSEGIPREALVLLNQSISLTKEQALEMVKKHIVSGDAQVNQLCQQLLGPDDWATVAKTLEGLDGDSEQLRRGVMTYMRKVLSKKYDIRAVQIMKAFSTPTYDNGINGIWLASALVKVLPKK
jgi:DNA polymerase-3 subunit gamma/tau